MIVARELWCAASASAHYFLALLYHASACKVHFKAWDATWLPAARRLKLVPRCRLAFSSFRRRHSAAD